GGEGEGDDRGADHDVGSTEGRSSGEHLGFWTSFASGPGQCRIDADIVLRSKPPRPRQGTPNRTDARPLPAMDARPGAPRPDDVVGIAERPCPTGDGRAYPPSAHDRPAPTSPTPNDCEARHRGAGWEARLGGAADQRSRRRDRRPPRSPPVG